MNDKLIQHHLRRAAEQAVPDDLDLWPAVRAQLEASRKGDIPMNLNLRQRRLRTLALSTLATVLLVAVVFATPWGQAFAQSVFRYFAVAPADSFPLPTAEQIQFYGVEPTIAPTFAAQLKPVVPTPIEPEATATSMQATFVAPVLSGCEGSAALTYRCQVSKAEAAVGFDLKEPPGDLQGLVFSSAGSNPTLQLATLIYTAIGGGSQLTITQVRGDMSTRSWGEVPPSAAVEKVKVDKFDGEYVRGTFAVEPGAMSATWWADGPVRRLRWREGDVLFEIRLDGHVAYVEYLEKDTMIALAESLTYSPAVGNQLRADYLTSVADAETLAGFDLLEPMILPEGFSFKYAEFDTASKRVRLVYEAGTGAGIAGIVIFQTPIADAPNTDFAEGLPPEAVETVQINGVTAQYTAGSYYADYVPTPGVPTPVPVWNPDDSSRSLIWRTDRLLIEVFYFSSQWYGGRLDRADMIAIAESMK